MAVWRFALTDLECVASGTIRKFEWILRQFKEETRRLSSAKSRVDDAEMAQKTPKLRIREFLRHTLVCLNVVRQRGGYPARQIRH